MKLALHVKTQLLRINATFAPMDSMIQNQTQLELLPASHATKPVLVVTVLMLITASSVLLDSSIPLATHTLPEHVINVTLNALLAETPLIIAVRDAALTDSERTITTSA
jgi:hypothetical protein